MKAVYKASRKDNGWQRFNILTSPTKLRSNESFLVEYTMFEMIMNFELTLNLTLLYDYKTNNEVRVKK